MDNKKIIDKIVAICMSVVFTMVLINPIKINAQEKEEYPYTIFASLNDEGAICIEGNNICINGDLASKGTIKLPDAYNQNGKLIEKSCDNMIYIFDKIDNEYFKSEETNYYYSDCSIDEQNIYIDKATEVKGKIKLVGNVNIKNALKALDNIIVNGEVKNVNDNSIIFSKYGDIIINSSNINISGLIYAPFGKVQITSQNIDLNGTIIIAKSVTINASCININKSNELARLIGIESESIVIPNDEKKYIEDKDITEIGNSSTEQETTETGVTTENTTEITTEVTTEDITEITTEVTTEDITEITTEVTTENEYNKLISDFENWDKYEDTDGDGLPDDFEKIIGSDRVKQDTDGDGLNDYYEYIMLGTSVTLNDTDNNSISDDKEDFDDDGLNNKEEYILGTMPWEDDSDNDGIYDGDEKYKYRTDSLNNDTDGDGLLDGEEISLGLNPLKKDSDGNGIEDNKERIEQEVLYDAKQDDTTSAISKVKIEMKTAGGLEINTRIEPIKDRDVGCSQVPGIFGDPYEIDTNCEFDNAKLSFIIDKSQLGDTDFSDLIVLWYDEDKEIFREIETLYDEPEQTLSIQTTHFSKYLVVDSNKWVQAWEKVFDYENFSSEENETYYTSIIFDLSIPRELRNTAGNTSDMFGTQMTEYHKKYISICKKIGNALGSMIGENDKICVSGQFRNFGYVADDIRTKDQLMDKINSLDVWCQMDWCQSYDDDNNEGFSYGSLGYAMGYPTRLQGTGNIERRIIYISGCNTDIPKYLINNAVRNKVKIYTLGLGEYVKSKPLIEMADRTNGKYCKINNITDIKEVMDNLNIDYSDMIDSDNDGIPDVMEVEGIRNQYGKVVYMDPYCPDTDGDGLLDGEEIDITIKNKKTITDVWGNLFDSIPDGAIYYNMKSDPTIIDTDKDGYTDYEEIMLYHTNARYSDVKIYKLKNDYISVGEEQSYGGNQGWLGDDKSFINRKGCGVVSACDTLLYLTKYEECKSGLADQVIINGSYFNKNEYIKYVVTMNNKYLPMKEDGLLGTTMARGVSRYFRDSGTKKKATWKSTDIDLLEDMEEMINQDIPVPIAANTIKEGYGDEYKIKMYQSTDNNIWWIKDKLIGANKFHSHYVTVTAIAEDNISGKKWLQVSSWGNKYFIDFDEYSEYAKKYAQWGWIATNILHIEKER